MLGPGTSRLVVAFALLLGSAPAQEPLLPRAECKPLEQASLELARTGRTDEWREVAAVLTALGLPAKDAEAHRVAAERELGRARAGAPVARAVKLLREFAAGLDKRLPALPEDARRRLAEQLLRLDGDCAEAHRTFGRESFQGRWGLPGEAGREARRREIAVAQEQARKLSLPIAVGDSDDPLLTAALGKPGTCAKWGALELHTGFLAAKTERLLRQTLRAAAFANFLDTGKLEVPDYGAQKSVVFRSRQQYLDAVRQLRASGKADAESAATASRDGMYSWRFTNLQPALQLCNFDMEGDAEVMWLTTLEYWRGKYPCLTAGRVNLVCRELLGQPMPHMAELVTKDVAPGGGTRGIDPRAAAERARWLALAPAGMHGGRLWMRYLAARGEDPKWSATMHEQLATIQGDELLKATLVVDFLAEEGRLIGLAKAADGSGKQNQPDAFAAALGESLPEFEQRWRAWLLGPGAGVVQRLQLPPDALPAATAAVLAAVQRLRQQAGLPDPVEHDAELSEGCRAHARYLTVHRDQTERWPDCHEQYADREGWSAAGAMAGHASVIAPGVKSDDQALAAWMATFYHRVPLLDPGLRRIGYAREADIAVLDCGSMVDPRTDLQDVVVVWPFDGMTGTPTHFAPEMPNPVPDQDQAKFGYPITLQCTARSSRVPVDVRLVLREKDERGPELACWFSSPQAPSNPVLAPANTFCLIPKAPLRRGAVYHVEAEFLGEGARLRWTFRT